MWWFYAKGAWDHAHAARKCSGNQTPQPEKIPDARFIRPVCTLWFQNMRAKALTTADPAARSEVEAVYDSADGFGRRAFDGMVFFDEYVRRKQASRTTKCSSHRTQQRKKDFKIRGKLLQEGVPRAVHRAGTYLRTTTAIPGRAIYPSATVVANR